MMVLAQQITQGDEHTGWYLGLGVGFVVVVVVVILVSMILMQAQRIVHQALDGIELMDQAREASLHVWEMQNINHSATRIWRSAEAARKILTEEGVAR